MNTKPGKMFKHRLVVWEPERTFTVEQLVGLLRLQVGQTKAPPQHHSRQRAQAEQTVALPERFNKHLTPEQITDLRSALNAIDPDAYDNWSDAGLALKPYGKVGKELWLTWSMRSAKYNPREAEEKWNTAFNDTRSTYLMVFAIAQKPENGWVNPRSNAARDPNAPPAPKPDNVVPDFVERMNKRQAEEKVEDNKAHRAAMDAGANKAEYDTTTVISKASLPPFCKSLIDLPYGLGLIQDYFYNIMPFPERALAGFSALSMFGCVAMANKTVDSRHGLSFNQYNLALIETGGGKEEMRRGIAKTHGALTWDSGVAKLQYALPASLQGLHDQLVEDNVQMYVADEYAEWLVGTKSDSHRQGSLAYLIADLFKCHGHCVSAVRFWKRKRPPPCCGTSRQHFWHEHRCSDAGGYD